MTIATLPQATKVLELITQRKVPSDRLQWLLEGGFLADLLEADGNLNRDEFREFLSLGKLQPDLMELEGIVIPENATIASLKAAGNYGGQSVYAEDYITDEHLKVTVTGPRHLCLAHFNKKISKRHVIKAAEKLGYTMALIEDLLAVGAHPKYQKLQRQFPIIALGSCVAPNDEPLVARLDGERTIIRGLCLDRIDEDWEKECRFLFVKEPMATLDLHAS